MSPPVGSLVFVDESECVHDLLYGSADVLEAFVSPKMDLLHAALTSHTRNTFVALARRDQDKVPVFECATDQSESNARLSHQRPQRKLDSFHLEFRKVRVDLERKALRIQGECSHSHSPTPESASRPICVFRPVPRRPGPQNTSRAGPDSVPGRSVFASPPGHSCTRPRLCYRANTRRHRPAGPERQGDDACTFKEGFIHSPIRVRTRTEPGKVGRKPWWDWQMMVDERTGRGYVLMKSQFPIWRFVAAEKCQLASHDTDNMHVNSIHCFS